jgi:hypothetical protein
MSDNTVVNIGDLCVYCARSTAAGLGLFVNRIGADSQWKTMNDELVWVDGWMCADCQEEGEMLAESFGGFAVEDDLTDD